MNREQIEARIAELKAEIMAAPGLSGAHARAELIKELEAQLPCSTATREAVAFELWQRFAPVHHIGWADETHKAEYYAAADGVLAVLPAPAQPALPWPSREVIAREIRRAMLDNPTDDAFNKRAEKREEIANVYADIILERFAAARPSPAAEPPRDLGLCDRVKCGCSCREALAKEVERLTRARSAPAAVEIDVLSRLVDWTYLHATEGEVWPSSKTKADLITRASHDAPRQEHADGMKAAAPQRSSAATGDAVTMSKATAEWIISQALWRMYEHGKRGRPVSAQCEVQHVTNLINGIVTLNEPQQVEVPAIEDADWPGKPFTFHDEPGEHDPCYVVMPDGAMLPLNHHAGEGVDIARAKFIIAACNAALATGLPPSPMEIEVIVTEAMQDRWNDICADTGCHPLDIKQTGKGRLEFHVGHWARQVGKYVSLALSRPQSRTGEA